MLSAAPLSADEKYHGSMPANTISAYGAAPSLAIGELLNKIVNTTMVRRASAPPRDADQRLCLYRTATSRRQESGITLGTPTDRASIGGLRGGFDDENVFFTLI